MTLHLYVILSITGTFIVAVTAQQNLALHGNVDQDTTFTDENGTVYSANLAIEGPVNNNWNDGCSSTQPGRATAWWGLFLPEVAYIINVRIYFRGDKPDQMDDFRLYLSNVSLWNSDITLCYTDRGIAGLPETTQDINCNILAEQVYFFNRDHDVQLCYIQINGCFKGTWGNNCTSVCPSNCINNHCYPENGSCVWGCDPNNCINNTCNIQTGVCTDGCLARRAGQFCSKYNLATNGIAAQSPLNLNRPASLSIDGNRTNGMCSRTTGPASYLQVDTGSMSVVTTVYIIFGDAPVTTGDNVVYCSNTSDSWVDGIVLYTGERPTKDINVYIVCRYITYVPSPASGVDVCEIEIGGCPLERYGENCEHFCHCKVPYDLVTGQCELGCLDGWTGERCDRACNNGYFGGECNKTCSENCLNSPCNRVSGECNGGCNKGWKGYDCTKECDVGYFGWNCSQSCFGCIFNMCDKAQGNCNISGACKPGYANRPYCNVECNDWYFGINCTKRCNCLNNPCNKFDGACSADKCAKGWQDTSCDKRCGSGYFGLNCANVCETCFNQSCDIFEGICRIGCKDGYRGQKCETAVSTVSSAVIRFGFFIGGLASMCVVLLIIWIVKM